MTADEVDAALAAAEADLAAGKSPDGRAFWAAVAAVKRDDELVDRFADRVGAVDQALFVRWAPLRVPMAVGTSLMVVATVAGLVLVGATYFLDDPWNGLAFVAGTLALMVTVHGLAHLAVGRRAGIRFTSWFVTLSRPQPGVKTDYSTYLRAPARSRAWMHASGAIATKVVPFLLLPVGPVAGAPWWSTVAVLALGVVALVTDVVWSVTASDWKKYRREMAVARSGHR